jgi:hypothetical protein
LALAGKGWGAFIFPVALIIERMPSLRGLGVAQNEIRPTRIERRARLVNAIARGRRWLGEIVSGSVTDVQ